MGALVSKVASRWKIDGAFAKTVEAELSLLIQIDAVKDEKYAAMKVQKAFTGGYRANSVSLLEGGEIVRKQYKMKHEAGRRYFWHEVGILTKLYGCPYVPKLLHFDRQRGTIYESFCGEAVYNSEDVQARIRQQLKEIKEKWGVHHKGGFHPRLGNSKTTNQTLNNITSLKKPTLFHRLWRRHLDLSTHQQRPHPHPHPDHHHRRKHHPTNQKPQKTTHRHHHPRVHRPTDNRQK